MKLRIPRTFLVWLAIVLGTALGAFVPASAMAHPGHGSGDYQAGAEVQSTEHGARMEQGEPDGAVSGRAAVEAVPCGGAACCTSGHGCCAAIPVACPATGAMPRDAALPSLHAGLPAGLGMSMPAEPPRPVR